MSNHTLTKIYSWIIMGMSVIYAFFAGFFLDKTGTIEIIQALVKNFLLLIFILYLINGKKWAYWITGILLIAGGAGGLAAIFIYGKPGGFFGKFYLVYSSLYTGFGIYLIQQILTLIDPEKRMKDFNESDIALMAYTSIHSLKISDFSLKIVLYGLSVNSGNKLLLFNLACFLQKTNSVHALSILYHLYKSELPSELSRQEVNFTFHNEVLRYGLALNREELHTPDGGTEADREELQINFQPLIETEERIIKKYGDFNLFINMLFVQLGKALGFLEYSGNENYIEKEKIIYTKKFHNWIKSRPDELNDILKIQKKTSEPKR